jgi:hypothetical protein
MPAEERAEARRIFGDYGLRGQALLIGGSRMASGAASRRSRFDWPGGLR